MARVRFINQYSKNNKELAKFYTEVIGLTVDKPQEDWYGFEKTTAQFAIEPESNRRDNVEKFDANWSNPYLLQIEVDSVQEMREILDRAKIAGTPVLTELEESSYGTLSKLLDPDGNLIELLLEK